MIVVDVNILVYAVNTSSDRHSVIKPWWESLLQSNEPVAFCWPVVSGFVRVTTQRHTMERPIDVDVAIEFIDDWLRHPSIRLVEPVVDHWSLFSELLREVGRGGKLTSDAHLAAIAIGNGAKLASCDVDFARFSKLRWVNPLAA